MLDDGLGVYVKEVCIFVGCVLFNYMYMFIYKSLFVIGMVVVMVGDMLMQYIGLVVLVIC